MHLADARHFAAKTQRCRALGEQIPCQGSFDGPEEDLLSVSAAPSARLRMVNPA